MSEKTGICRLLITQPLWINGGMYNWGVIKESGQSPLFMFIEYPSHYCLDSWLWNLYYCGNFPQVQDLCSSQMPALESSYFQFNLVTFMLKTRHLSQHLEPLKATGFVLWVVVIYWVQIPPCTLVQDFKLHKITLLLGKSKS